MNLPNKYAWFYNLPWLDFMILWTSTFFFSKIKIMVEVYRIILNWQAQHGTQSPHPQWCWVILETFSFPSRECDLSTLAKHRHFTICLLYPIWILHNGSLTSKFLLDHRHLNIWSAANRNCIIDLFLYNPVSAYTCFQDDSFPPSCHVTAPQLLRVN